MTVLRGRVLRLGQVAGHPGPHGIEIDVGHAGEHRRVVEQCLAFEAAFPEAAGARVLAIGAAREKGTERAKRGPREKGTARKGDRAKRREKGTEVIKSP